MGFLSKIFGGGSSEKYDPASYGACAGTPSLETSVTKMMDDDAKDPEKPDTKEYEESKKRRRRSGGVAGSFGWTQVDNPIGG